MVLAAVGTGGEMLASILGPTHRMTAPHRQPRQADFFRQQDSLMSKATADIRRNDTNLALLHAEAFGQTTARDMRHLRCGIERELIEAVIEGRDDATPLERRHALPCGRYLARHLDRRVERAGDVDFEIGLEENVIAPMIMH